MKSRVVFQLANGFVAALLLTACAKSGQNKPLTVASPPPAVVQAAPAPQPLLPVLKPGTKKRAPAKPRLDVEATAPAGDAPLQAETGGGTVSPGAADAKAATPSEVDILLGQVPPAPPLVAPQMIPAEPEPVETASAPADLSVDGSPDDLRGQTEIQVINQLGSPVSTRAEGTSTIWSYKSGDCGLDVYFFLDVADNQRRALSYEFNPNRADGGAQQRCYLALKSAAGH